MSRAEEKLLTRILVIFIAGLLSAVAARYVHRLLDRVEQATNFGYTPNPAGVTEFLKELGEDSLFSNAAPDVLKEAAANKQDMFLYRFANKAHIQRYGKPWIVGKQGIGDCTSWGWAHAIFISQSIDWETGKLSDPPLMPATESVYGGGRVEARGRAEGGGGWSDGSYGGACARWVRDWGVIYREPVGSVDLTNYSASRAKSWGNWGNGGEGDKGRLDAIAKKHPAKHVALVRNFDEAAAAIQAGFAIPVCSMVGFSSTRDKDGFAPATTMWAHCMCLCAVRYQENGSPRDGILCLNSWGPNWNAGPKWPADQPDGSFWISRETVDRMLQGKDSFAVGSIDGFGWRDLNHGNWLHNE
jgi:hypothetical protein